MELDCLNFVQVTTLVGKDSQRLAVFENPKLGCLVCRARCEIAAKWRKAHLPHGRHVTVIDHQRTFGLQTPSPYGVVKRTTQEMFVTNRYGHGKHWSSMANERILLLVTLSSHRTLILLFYGRPIGSFVLVFLLGLLITFLIGLQLLLTAAGRLVLLLLLLLLLFVLWIILRLLEFIAFRVLVFINAILEYFDICFYLLFYKIIHGQDIV